jgi:hypothetical protein
MDKHLTRRELLKAARKEATYKHLDECQECREAAEMLRQFLVAGNIPLQKPPGGWTEKAVAIAHAKPHARKKKFAELVFDSWAVARPVGVRGSESLTDRRLRFESKELLFDLRAEKKKSGWSFIAQVHSLSERYKHSRIQIGKDIIDQDAVGIFQWSSPKPPKKIHLLINDSVVEIPELVWRKSPK